MELLPREIMYQISCHLSLRDILALKCTNKYWSLYEFYREDLLRKYTEVYDYFYKDRRFMSIMKLIGMDTPDSEKIRVLKHLREMGLSIIDITCNYCQFLHKCCINGTVELLEYLYSLNIHKHLINEYCFIEAFRNGNMNVVLYILNKMDCKLSNKVILNNITRKCTIEMIKILTFKYSMKDIIPLPLNIIKTGNVDILDFLLEYNAVFINTASSNIEYISTAIYSDNFDMFMYMINLTNIDKNALKNYLYVISFKDNIRMFDWVIKNTDISVEDIMKDNIDILYRSFKNNNVNMVKYIMHYLTTNGIDINMIKFCVNIEGLFIGNNYESIVYMFENWLSIKDIPVKIFGLMTYKYPNILKYLLGKGISINFIRSSNILYNAIRSAHLKSFKLLVDYKDPNNDTIEKRDIRKNNYEILKLIAKYGKENLLTYIVKKYSIEAPEMSSVKPFLLRSHPFYRAFKQ